jgi:hypothetical protein
MNKQYPAGFMCPDETHKVAIGLISRTIKLQNINIHKLLQVKNIYFRESINSKQLK